MSSGYPLRKYDWKDWLLMILTSSLILQIIVMVFFSNLVIFFPNLVNSDSSILSEELLQIVVSKGVVYGTLLSLPLTLFVVYKRKIPLFNRKGLSKEESFIIQGLNKDDWNFLKLYIPISYIIYILGSVLVENIFGASEAINQIAIESLFDQFPMWQLFLMIVVVAPITEELLFRGILLFPGDKLNTSWMRLFMSALVFGLVHIITDIDVYTFYTYVGMGLIFTYAAKHTKTLEASIVYHVLNNLMGFLIIVLYN